ncbi:MAG: hypothetical protein J1E16_04920 [Muribaculaceae bacterium]|nr:hypothetical protein [Muribaculaceae bacterium]
MLKQIILFVLICLSPMMVANEINFDKESATVIIGDQKYTLDENHFLLTHEKHESPYIFNNALEVIDAVNKSNASKITLFVSPSVYWLDDPDDTAIRYPTGNTGNIPYAAEISCDTLSIIGLSKNPEDVVFAVNRGQTQGAIGNYTMLHFKGKSLHTENMTYGNYCNIDLEYPSNPSFNRQKRNNAIVQAQLGICDGTDRLFARNCRFLSRLNLCPLVGARRSLYKDCYFECTDDALSGSAVYLDCQFTFYSGKPFYSTSPTGAVFLNCDINSKVVGHQYLTKMPGMVTLIDTRFTGDPNIELQWTPYISPIRSYQSNVTLNDKQVKIDSERPELGVDITDLQLLKAFKIADKDKIIYNTPNLLGRNDGWDPLEVLPLIKEEEKKIGQSLTSIPVTLNIISSARKLEPKGDTLNLTVSPRLWGDYPISNDKIDNVHWTGPSTINLILKNNDAVATSANNSPNDFEGFISATTSEGLTGATKIKINPLLKEAPEFIEKPTLSLDGSIVKVNYNLNSEGNDESFIVWYRSKLPGGVNGIPVRHGKGERGATYNLTSADHGFYISTSICPKLSDSHEGEILTCYLDEEIMPQFSKSLPEKELVLSTSFEEIPIVKGQLGKPGFWNFDTYKPSDTMEHDWKADENLSWYYGYGADAATGIGLVQATRGARLSYTPILNASKGMRLSFIAEPCKGPGQGFGSATGQYMDICIKFDPLSLNGYALRIERTPDYDKAVTFTLMEYKDGNINPISESVASNCFRNPCLISLEINENSFTASASTEAPAVETGNPDIKPYVSLAVPIENPSANSSFVIQHTGTVGASATLIRDLNVSWE